MRTARTVVRYLWLLVCIGTLVGYVLYPEGVMETLATYGMIGLTFPIGFAVFLGAGAISWILLLAFDVDVASRSAVVLTGIAMIAAAYWQWSKLLSQA